MENCIVAWLVLAENVERITIPTAWALAIIAIREYLLRRDGDPLDILSENKPRDYAILHFGKENVYLLGFTINHRAYEYGKQGKIIHEIPGSTFLGYDSGRAFGRHASIAWLDRNHIAPLRLTNRSIAARKLYGIIELKPVRVIEAERRTVGKRFERCLRVEWNNSEVNRQIMARMCRDYPMLETTVRQIVVVLGGDDLSSIDDGGGGGGRAALEADAFLAAGDELCICHH
ncbi:hypothetical protein Tco_0682656 [Tanacetum coccineum]|uniref:rRNA N-glycosidase n=1 Tax=Tanacetum coccineum TaxID=301880 RepID=A0ABQ4XSQ4_9ASTR